MIKLCLNKETYGSVIKYKLELFRENKNPTIEEIINAPNSDLNERIDSNFKKLAKIKLNRKEKIGNKRSVEEFSILEYVYDLEKNKRPLENLENNGNRATLINRLYEILKISSTFNAYKVIKNYKLLILINSKFNFFPETDQILLTINCHYVSMH